MKHLKYFITFEGKLQDLENKIKDKLSDFEISNLKSLSNNSSIYFNWLLNIYLKDKDKYKENIAGVNILLDVLDDYFKKFLRIKNNLPIKDIQQIESSKQFIKLIDDYNDYNNIENDKNVTLLLNNNRWIVFVPHTFESSQKWGWGRFCSVHDVDYYNLHNVKNDALIYIINKFDYTKHCVIQQKPNGYMIWDYEDDYYFVTDKRGISEYLHEYLDDGYLNIYKIVGDIPYVGKQDFVNHYYDIIIKKYNNDVISLEDIAEILEQDEFTEDDFSELKKLMSNVINKIPNNLHDFI